jgi:hypothetical protein
MPRKSKARSTKAKKSEPPALYTLSDTILNPAVPWDPSAPTDKRTIENILRYRYSCTNPLQESTFEIIRRDRKTEKSTKVADAPAHYMKFVQDLNWNSAFLADMYGAAEWPANSQEVLVMKKLLFYFNRVRKEFIEEVRDLGAVSNEWRSKVLDSFAFVLYFKSNFGRHKELCESDLWHVECKQGEVLDIFELSNSLFPFLFSLKYANTNVRLGYETRRKGKPAMSKWHRV